MTASQISFEVVKQKQQLSKTVNVLKLWVEDNKKRERKQAVYLGKGQLMQLWNLKILFHKNGKENFELSLA